MEPPEADVPTPHLTDKAFPDVEPIPDASNILPLDDNTATMEAAPPLFADDAPAGIAVVPSTQSPEPMLIMMHPPDLEADEPLTRLTSLLSPTEAVPELIEKSLLSPVVPASAVVTVTVPELVSLPMPEAMAMEPPKAEVPLLLSFWIMLMSELRILYLLRQLLVKILLTMIVKICWR